MTKNLKNEYEELNSALRRYTNILDEIQLKLFGGEDLSLEDLMALDFDSLIAEINAILTREDFVMDKYISYIKINFADFIKMTNLDHEFSILVQFNQLLKRVEHYKSIVTIRILSIKIKREDNDYNSNLSLLASTYLDMLLNNTITILDIPLGIQKLIKEMLQTEFGIDASFEELLKMASYAKIDNMMLLNRTK